METLTSPRMLSCGLGRSCLASLALAFLAVNVRVKGSRDSPGCRVSRAKIKYTLGHILVFIFDSFFLPSPMHAPYSRSRMYAFILLSLLMDWELSARVYKVTLAQSRLM